MSKNVSQTVLLLLALLFTSCLADDSIPDDDEDYYADTYEQRAFEDRLRRYVHDKVPIYRYDWNAYRQTPYRPWQHNTKREEDTDRSRYTTFSPRWFSRAPSTTEDRSDVSQSDDERDCPICCTEGALQDRVVKCLRCKKCICQDCYNRIDNATNTYATYDPNLGRGGFRIRKKCPFCNNPDF